MATISGGAAGDPGLVLISSAIADGAVSELTLSSIPAGYASIVIVGRLRYTGGATGENGLITINGDTGSNYEYARTWGGWSSGNAVAATNEITVIQGTDAASSFSNFQIECAGYDDDKTKVLSAYTGYRYLAVRSYMFTYVVHWDNTDAITSIAIAPASANLTDGSSLYLYGRKA